MKKVWNAEEKLQYERALQAKGYRYIVGVDEVGRGPLAGPVVCAAVVMPLDEAELIVGVDDSKKLSAKKREELAKLIKEKAIAYTMVEVSEKMIDEINILEATKLGMKQAIETLVLPEELEAKPEIVLTDGNMTLDVALPQHSVVHGDALSYSIGAASIIAKVYRDGLMDEFAKTYPHYGFEKNKGYGTAAHIKGIKEYGLCPIHRRTFTKKF
ncbi:MAG: ribonuclease HII [Clostridia bacterium]|nr:ribonuclease HII [Clostridia bacterium]